jgi:RNA polymerase sigma factor (sigma-70 family)
MMGGLLPFLRVMENDSGETVPLEAATPKKYSRAAQVFAGLMRQRKKAPLFAWPERRRETTVDLKASQRPTTSNGAVQPGESSPAPGAEGADTSAATDGELVTLASTGDRDAFECLLRRHYDRIHRLAWRFAGSAADAEDIAQEVCCKLVEKVGTFKGDAKFTTWLTGIAVNACRDHYRRGRAITRLKNHLGVSAELAPSHDGRDLHASMWLGNAIARLDPALRDTVVLVAGEDMSHAEAASALGVAESTISWRMREVRRLLAAEPEGGG